MEVNVKYVLLSGSFDNSRINEYIDQYVVVIVCTSRQVVNFFFGGSRATRGLKILKENTETIVSTGIMHGNLTRHKALRVMLRKARCTSLY